MTAHIEFLQRLQAGGATVLSGPLLGEDGSWEGSGVTAIRVESLNDAQRIMVDEPLSMAGRTRQSIHRWKVTSGTLAISVSLSDAGTGLT